MKQMLPLQISQSPPGPSPLLLEGLNAEQQEAVLASGAPLFILAGAGTGKTRVICSRIAHLLSQPGFSPENILTLTFSRRTAQELLERVERLHGTYADEMGIFTFHGFCLRFLQEHAVELGLPAHFRLLGETDAWVFFREMLPELRLAYHWNVADPTGCIKGFLGFINRARDEMVSPEEFLAHARKMEDAGEKARAEEIARAYRLYRKKMEEAGNLDFGDLINRTLRAFQERPALLKELRGRYRAILVDEFQDTNVAQIQLLRELAGSGEGLCVVGDDDQAIYRFRGASFASFVLMKQHFPGVRTLRLTRNYRSSAVILSAAGRLIRHNEPDRYDPQKNLWTEQKGGAPVEVAVCGSYRREAEEAIRVIRRLYENQPSEERRWDRVAVLYRAHAHREHLVEALRTEGIPFLVRGGSSLCDSTEVRDLIAFLQAAQDPADSVAFFRLLSHPLWGIPGDDLLALSRKARGSELSIEQSLRGPAGSEASEGARRSVAALLQDLDRVRARASAGIEEAVSAVLEGTFLRAAFRLPPGPTGDPAVSLGRFLRLAYQYANNHPERRDLASFLWYLDSVMKAPRKEQSEEEEEPSADGVRLMTVHQAKGLEFDWVVLLSLTKGRFPSEGRREEIPFPVELMKESLPQGDYHEQEERRLFYVACTRAKKGLVLLTQDRNYHRPSPFIREILEGAPEAEAVRRVLEPAPDPKLEDMPLLGPERLSLAAEREAMGIFAEIRGLRREDGKGFDQALEKLGGLARSAWLERRALPAFSPGMRLPPVDRLSFTQLESYRFCPMKYLYGYVYRIPTRSTPQMALGTDLHDCLQGFYQEVIEGRVPALEEMTGALLRKHRPGRYGEPYQDEEYRRIGLDLLTQFYRKHEGSFAAPLFVERPFLLQLGEVSLKGVVDRVDPVPDGGVEVIDYKSGKPKKKADRDDQLQLWIYALAAREVFGLETRRVSFYYLKDSSVLSFEPGPETLKEAKETILMTAGEIRAGKFDPTPSLDKCRRCDFRAVCPASMA